MAEDKIDNHLEEAATAEPAPDLPDYLTDPNAVTRDEGVEWRYGKPPDYSKTRKEWERSKCITAYCQRHDRAATPASQHPLLLDTWLSRARASLAYLQPGLPCLDISPEPSKVGAL